MTAAIKLFHPDDPNPLVAGDKGHIWHFCYLHGKAERHNAETAEKNNWGDGNRQPDDLIQSDTPFPEKEGDYECELYGLRVTVFIRTRFGGAMLGGRGAAPDDTAAYQHAMTPTEWA